MQINKNDVTWNIDNPEDMRVIIRYKGQDLFHFSMYEAIESCNRQKVLSHVKECDNSPWLTRWQEEKHQVLTDLLKEEYDI